jgi:hypothetical protein
MIEGSYFNQMLDCGTYYNEWVQHALSYLPEAVLDEHKDGLVFISTAQRDGCRMARGYCDTREVILLSERILPKHGAEEGQPEVRYFIYVVLHEVAHAIKKHKSPKLDNLTEQENLTQEDEADAMAMEWFNEHVKAHNNPFLKPITRQEVNEAQRKNIALMERLYGGV